jgi:prevent-host-death family protein
MANKEYTVGFTEAKANLGRITTEVNRTGDPVTVLKNNKPWVVIYPAQAKPQQERVVNLETLAAMDEAEQMASDPARAHYTNVTDMLEALNAACADA